VEADSDDDRVREAVLADPKVQAHTLGKTVERIVVIKNRLVNMVVH
jgi:leucyl-tRNA synthetase